MVYDAILKHAIGQIPQGTPVEVRTQCGYERHGEIWCHYDRILVVDYEANKSFEMITALEPTEQSANANLAKVFRATFVSWLERPAATLAEASLN
jgi:hypothetical protein